MAESRLCTVQNGLGAIPPALSCIICYHKQSCFESVTTKMLQLLYVAIKNELFAMWDAEFDPLDRKQRDKLFD